MKKTPDTPITPLPDYTEAFRELQSIISEMEDGEIPVDTLSEKVKRAALLIRICKDKLHATEGDVGKILAELEADENQANS
jgi:exodeoxyribonuclease VII small subunit